MLLCQGPLEGRQWVHSKMNMKTFYNQFLKINTCFRLNKFRWISFHQLDFKKETCQWITRSSAQTKWEKEFEKE